MVRSEFLAFTVLVVLMTVSFQEALALRCWHCSSKDQPYCSDPFDTDQLSPEQRAGNYADCNKGEFGRSVCLKMISKENGIENIKRLCSATSHAAEEACKANGADNICEICETDGCNSGIQYGPLSALIALPIAIVKLFSF